MAGAARFYVNQDDWSKGRDRVKGQGMRLHLTTSQNIDEIERQAGRVAALVDSARAERLPSEPLVMSACCPSTTGMKSGSGEVDPAPLRRRTALPLAISITMMAPGPEMDESVT